MLEEKESKINGKIQVVKSLGFGTYIQVDGLTQSGGVVYEVWKSALKKVKGEKLKVNSCLILGLGGGSAAKLVRKMWPDAKITGVDIDPVIVELGKNYLELEVDEFVEADAAGFFKNKKKKYDLILIDTYVGDKYPENFENEDFLMLIKNHLNKDGVAVFNRLYWDEKRKLAHEFLKKLESVFEDVLPFYPEANIMFISS